MSGWTAGRVRAALGLPSGADDARVFAAISTDTRSIVPGALFVALAGDRFDGHDYLEAARVAGATGAVVRGGTAVPSGKTAFSGPVAPGSRHTISSFHSSVCLKAMREKKAAMPARRASGHFSARAPMKVSATAAVIAVASRPWTAR
jgi:UDP-N-acetylmuramyl pentapeptide synthase